MVRWLVRAVLVLLLLNVAAGRQTIDVIISTDLGTDIDDTFALAHLLALSKPSPSNDPLVNVLCIITATSDTYGRLKILAKLLTDSGSTYSSIPIVQGSSEPLTEQYLAAGEQAGFPWAENFDLNTYDGPVIYESDWLPYVRSHLSGRSSSSPPVVFLELAPPVNSAALLSSLPPLPPFPVLAMSGSVYKGYDSLPPSVPEFNVLGYNGTALSASCVLYHSSSSSLDDLWPTPGSFRPRSSSPRLAAAPLDVSGSFRISGPLYSAFRAAASSGDSLASTVLSHYASWLDHEPYNDLFDKDEEDVEEGTTTLWDVVAVGLFLQQVGALEGGVSAPLFFTQDLAVTVSEDGRTNVGGEGEDAVDDDECRGEVVREALEWGEGMEEAFKRLYVETIVRRID